MSESFSISNSISRDNVYESMSMSRATLEDEAGRLAEGIRPEAISNEQIGKGDEILETYRVMDAAIHGGMGSVWRVHHRNWNMDLAMKRPQPRFFAEGSERRKEEFIAECENWINLGLHPNIVSCYYVRDIGGVPTIFSEWMDGGSLKDAIKSGSLYEGSEEEVQARILDLAIQTMRGLKYSHENGLIHQDVKPGNILLTKEGAAKVADFGLAKARSRLAEGGSLASTGYTLEYCPKEQADGAEAEAWMDLYAWALTVLEMYAGERLWQKGSEAENHAREYFQRCRIAVPEAVRDLILMCLTKNSEPVGRVYSEFGDFPDLAGRIYQDITGQAYFRPEPKAVPDTAEARNNRALSFLDLGKSAEAEKIWKAKKNALHAESVLNHTLYQVREGNLGLHKGILELQNLFLKSPSENTAAAYARLLAFNGRDWCDAETSDAMTPEQKAAAEKVFHEILEAQGSRIPDSFTELPAPFGNASDFHQVREVYVDPQHRFALVADEWIWSDLTGHDRCLLLDLRESSAVRELPLWTSGVICNLQTDADGRYALCCSLYQDRATTKICAADGEGVQVLSGFRFCFFRDSALRGLCIENEHKIALYGLTEQDGGRKKESVPLWEAAVPMTLKGSYTIRCSTTGKILLIADRQKIWLMDTADGRLLHEYRQDNDREDWQTPLDSAVINEENCNLLVRDAGWNLYDAARNCNVMTGIFPEPEKLKGACLWAAEPSVTVLTWSDKEGEAGFALHALPSPRTWDYSINRVLPVEKAISDREKCEEELKRIRELLDSGKQAEAAAAWEAAHSLDGFMGTPGYQEAENRLDRLCVRCGIRCTEDSFSPEEPGKVLCIGEQGFVAANDGYVFYGRLSDGKILMKRAFRDFASEVRRAMTAALSADESTLYLHMEGDTPRTPIYSKIFVLDIRKGTCVADYSFKELAGGLFLLTHPTRNFAVFCGRGQNDSKEQLRTIDGENRFKMRKSRQDDPEVPETLQAGLSVNACWPHCSRLGIEPKEQEWIFSHSNLGSQARIELTGDRRFALVHSYLEAAVLYLPEHRKELELKEVVGEQYLSPDGRHLLTSSLPDYRIVGYTVHYCYLSSEPGAGTGMNTALSVSTEGSTEQAVMNDGSADGSVLQPFSADSAPDGESNPRLQQMLEECHKAARLASEKETEYRKRESILNSPETRILNADIAAKRRQLNSLGIFKKAEKKRITAELSVLEQKTAELFAACREAKEAYEKAAKTAEAARHAYETLKKYRC